jgi:hypothetical protein
MTDRLTLPLLMSGQAQKEVTHNEALVLLDMLVQAVAESASISLPPSAPGTGSCWIVPAGGSGAWADFPLHIACWTTGGWRFAAPFAGMVIWVKANGCLHRFDGAAWQPDAVRADGLHIGGEQVVGPRAAGIADPVGGTVVDLEARSAVGQLLAMLRNHGLIAA